MTTGPIISGAALERGAVRLEPLSWRREYTPGGTTVYTSGPWRIESWGGRSRNGYRTGYRPGSVVLYRDGVHVRGTATVKDAKAAAERRGLAG